MNCLRAVQMPSTIYGSLLVFGLLASWTTLARAELTISIEPQVGFAVPDAPAVLVGGAARIGYALDTYPILVMPELSLEGHYVGDADIGVVRAVAGARVGLTASVEPSLFLHLGYGGLAGTPWQSAVSLDAGVALDYRVERWLTVGGALSYVGFLRDGSLHGGLAGIHTTFWID